MSGQLVDIFLRPGARAPVRRVAQATAIAGQGLAGDHAGPGRREVTVLSLEAWRDACGELGQQVDPAVRRANLLVAGVDLAAAIGGRLCLGDVVVEVLGETRPCELLDDGGRIGLCAALRPHRRGGVHGRILRGGELRVGMACAAVSAAADRTP